ncbi:MAG: DoxX-like family protein [Longimicrobiaceae bacterium]
MSLRTLAGSGASPDQRLAAIHAVARVTLALAFLWHGLVPKLLYRHADELALLRDSGLSASAAERMVTIVGVAEVVYGIALLALWRVRALFLPAAVAMLVITPGILANSPRFIPAAFTPVTLNLCVAAVAIIGWIAGHRKG